MSISGCQSPLCTQTLALELEHFWMFCNNSFPLSLGLVQLQDGAVGDGTSLGNREDRAWARLLHLQLQNVTSPLWKPLTPFREKEPNGKENWKTKEKQSHSGTRGIWQLIPNCPSPQLLFTAPGAAWLGNRETFEDNSPERWGDGEHIDSFTPGRKHSTGRRGEIPSSGCILPKNPQCRDYLLLCITKVLFKQKHSPGASYQHFGFRFCSKLFISPQPNVHPYRKQILLGGSWVVLNIFWGWFLTLKLQMQQEVSILF